MDEEQLTPDTKVRFDKFVKEMEFDGKPLLAALRVGYSREYAQAFAIKAMESPYVQKRLAERVVHEARELTTEEHKAKQIAGLYRIAEDPATKDAARVAAYSALSRILGTDAPVKTITEHSFVDLAQQEALSEMSVEALEALKELARRASEGKASH